MKFYHIFATAFTLNAFVSSLEKDSSSRLLFPQGSKENEALRNDYAIQDTAVHDVNYDIVDARELNTLTRTEPVGLSNGEDWGNPFDDFAIVESNTRIEKNVVRSYDYWIRYIGVTYSNGQTFDHGTYSSGTATDTAELVVELDEDEHIVRPSLRATPSPTPSPSIRTQTQTSSMPTEAIDMFPPGNVETFSLVGGVQCLAERLRLAIASFQLLQNIICLVCPSF